MKSRLTTLAEMIVPYKKIADVGCDHGYLILEAFKLGITFAQAIDNKEGPLKSAVNNLQDYRDQVLFSLSDGISSLDPSVEVIVISGMGGRLITQILASNHEKLSNIKRIILQPNRNVDFVRKYMSKIGFFIVSEKIIFEESTYYELIVFEKGSVNYTAKEMMYGPLLLQERNELFLEKYQKLIEHYESIGSVEVLKKAKQIKLDLEL